MPLSAESRLVLVRVKVERAKKHLRDLEVELASFRNKDLAVVRTQQDAQGRHGAHDLSSLPVLPWNAIAAAGDVVHNLRSALDHLAYQLAEVGAPGHEPSRNVGFPIAKDAAAYESTKTRKIKSLRPSAVKVIDALNPYRGGNDALWRIHELDNIDKHRTLFTVGSDYLLIADWLPSAYPYLLKTSKPHFPGVFEGEVEHDVQLEIQKALSDPQAVQGDALLPSLRQLVDFVDNLVSEFLPLLA